MKTVGNSSGRICNQSPHFAIHDGTARRRLRQSTQMAGISPKKKSAG